MCVCASVLAGVREGLDPVKMDLQVVECCPVGAPEWSLGPLQEQVLLPELAL